MNLIFIILSSTLAFAKPAPVKAAKAEGILLETHIGDRHAWFVIGDNKGKPALKFSNNAGTLKVIPLTAADVQLLNKKIKELPAKSNDLALCPNTFTKITSQFGTRIACDQGKTPLNKKMSVITRALASLL